VISKSNSNPRESMMSVFPDPDFVDAGGELTLVAGSTI